MSLKDTRRVLKPLLDNPYPVTQFPIIPADEQRQILEFLLLQLHPISSWNRLRVKPAEPDIMNKITTGFNSTVKQLETQTRGCKERLVWVFVCKPDIEPPLLIQHFPVLCYNAQAKLVQLPRGSSAQIGDALDKRCSILGLYESDIPTGFRELLNKVPDIALPWLDNEFRELNVKMVETTAPVRK